MGLHSTGDRLQRRSRDRLDPARGGEVGYPYCRSAWGRGIATEAARPLVQIALVDPATTAVVACALAANAGSLRVLKKLGLKRVGEVKLPEASEPMVKFALSTASGSDRPVRDT